jgi:hypothetical protein
VLESRFRTVNIHSYLLNGFVISVGDCLIPWSNTFDNTDLLLKYHKWPWKAFSFRCYCEGVRPDQTQRQTRPSFKTRIGRMYDCIVDRGSSYACSPSEIISRPAENIHKREANEEDNVYEQCLSMRNHAELFTR